MCEVTAQDGCTLPRLRSEPHDDLVDERIRTSNACPLSCRACCSVASQPGSRPTCAGSTVRSMTSGSGYGTRSPQTASARSVTVSAVRSAPCAIVPETSRSLGSLGYSSTAWATSSIGSRSAINGAEPSAAARHTGASISGLPALWELVTPPHGPAAPRGEAVMPDPVGHGPVAEHQEPYRRRSRAGSEGWRLHC